jgi:diacylglycerol kinase (ATP)
MTLPALLVANAHSRRGREIEPFVAALKHGGLALRREECRRREDLGALIRRLRHEVGSVILGGGDGTMNAAAAALRDTGLPLGILPLGTANDLARTLGIPDDAEAAAGVILAGRTRRLDLGCVNGHPFFNVASMGLSVDITRRLTKLMKRRLGVFAYPVAAIAVIATAGRFHATLSTDGHDEKVRTMQIAVGNGRFYGGGMVVEEGAAIDDGLLDVYSLEPRARWRLLLMAREFRAGEHKHLDEVRTLRCRALTVTTRRPRHVSADGEIVTETPARFTVLPQAVVAFAP